MFMTQIIPYMFERKKNNIYMGKDLEDHEAQKMDSAFLIHPVYSQ